MNVDLGRDQALAARNDRILYVPPEDYDEWVKVTEPCETCRRRQPGFVLVPDLPSGRTRWEHCPDCIAGRPKITVRASCQCRCHDPNVSLHPDADPTCPLCHDGHVPVFTCTASQIVGPFDYANDPAWPEVAPGWFAVLLDNIREIS